MSGLLRCSKSCRLRWTNYLRPGIKRGNFTDQEEKMIILLQKLLGNRWAAIASYLPQRTDNDIKNYWNTHLKKKLRKSQSNSDQCPKSECLSSSPSSPKNHTSSSRGQWERRLQTDIHTAKQALTDALSSINQEPYLVSGSNPVQNEENNPSLIYALSTKNIARLLQGWTTKCPKKEQCSSISTDLNSIASPLNNDQTNSNQQDLITATNGHFSGLFDTIDQSTTESPYSNFSQTTISPDTSLFEHESKPLTSYGEASMTTLLTMEKWLFEDSSSHQFGSHGDRDEDLTDMPLQENVDFL